VKKIQTQVLVVGGGLSGLRTAIAARQSGSEVIIAAKSHVGRANNTTISNGGFSSSGSKFSKDQYFESTIQSGLGLSQEEMVRVLVNEAECSILELRKMGVDVKPREAGYHVPGISYQKGRGINLPMLDYCEEIGVNVKHQIFVIDLIIEDKTVVGVWGIDLKDAELVIISAPAVILATGGAGNIYSRTDNVPQATGDGYGMALQAGLTLNHMEFVQFYPISVGAINRVRSFLPPVVVEAGKLVNDAGELITEKYNIEKRPYAIRSRDQLSRAIALEERQGNKVLLDLTEATAKDWQHWVDTFGKGIFETKVDLEKRFNISQRPMEILPTTHFFMGGIPCNINGETAIKGLFAAGETASGIHGANRMGGNALSEAVVFGRRAGKAASVYSGRQEMNHLDLVIEEKINKYISLQKGSTNSPEVLQEVREKFQRVMWNDVGVVRTKERLIAAFSELKQLSKVNGSYLSFEDFSTTVKAIENRNAIHTAMAVTGAALARKKNKGAHYRLD